MNTESKLKVFKSGNYEYLYIYYRRKENLLRINTGYKFIQGMHKQDLLYNAKMDNYQSLNQQIEQKKQKVDEYITNRLRSYKQIVNQQECQYFIKTGDFFSTQVQPQQRINKTFWDYYSEFYSFKSTELQNKPSLKDYKSLENALLDYQNIKNIVLTLDLINDLDFFNKFRNFLFEKHPKKTSLTQGDLNSNTVRKRLSSLKTFMLYVESKKYFSFDSNLYKYKVQRFPVDFVIPMLSENAN
jgi:hypothetical protein